MSEENRVRAKHLVEVIGPEKAVDMIARAVSHIDVSRNARGAGDLGSAEGALTAARKILLNVLGIPTESEQDEDNELRKAYDLG